MVTEHGNALSATSISKRRRHGALGRFALCRRRRKGAGRACRQYKKADPKGSALETLPASPRLAQRHGRQGLRRERRTSAGLSHSIVSVDDAGRAAWSGDFELI
jgi:hypothetical protein